MKRAWRFDHKKAFTIVTKYFIQMKALFPLLFVFFASISFAQPRFVVQGGSARVFANINDAIADAQPGDTLYLPGGGFNLTNSTIDKTLHWVGAGHYPAYTTATGTSRIATTMVLTGNTDGSTFNGIHFQGEVRMGSHDNEAENITLMRCRVDGAIYLRTTDGGNPALAFSAIETVFLSPVVGYNATNCLFRNCIFSGGASYISAIHQSLFLNNLIATRNPGWPYSNLSVLQGCSFNNNIFGHTANLDGVTTCDFKNNIFATAVPLGGTNTFTDNTGDVDMTTVLESYTGDIFTFSYDHNYHVKADFPQRLNTTDGTEVGIYGTSAPYKEGAVPFYPYIKSAQIGAETSNNKLGVSITVEAQTR